MAVESNGAADPLRGKIRLFRSVFPSLRPPPSRGRTATPKRRAASGCAVRSSLARIARSRGLETLRACARGDGRRPNAPMAGAGIEGGAASLASCSLSGKARVSRGVDLLACKIPWGTP